MEYDFEDSKKSFAEYVDRCKDKLMSTFFTERDIFGTDVYNNVSNLSHDEINEMITNKRMKMIESKVAHTMRMVKQIIEINKILDVRFDFDLILKNAILFHDVGRFSQAMRGDTYKDSEFYAENSPVKNGFSNHGHEGSSVYLNEKFSVDDAYKWTISESIKYHGIPNDGTTPNTRYLDSDKIYSFGFDDLLKGPVNPKTVKEMNSSEILAFSLVTQLVADIDKIDILFQCKNATFDNGMLVRNHIFDKSRDSLSNIAKKWGVSKEDILDFNGSLTENTYDENRTDNGKKNVGLRIPIEKMDISKLKISDDFMYMLKTNNWPGSSDEEGLRLLQSRNDWNFLTIFLWRLGKFICDINVTAVLKSMDDLELLDDLKVKFIEMGNKLTNVSGMPMGNELFSLVEEGFNYVYGVVQERVFANRNNIIIEDKKIR